MEKIKQIKIIKNKELKEEDSKIVNTIFLTFMSASVHVRDNSY